LGARDSEEEARVPSLVPGWEGRCSGLSPEEGFLITRIDGATPWAVLRSIGGLAPEQADRCLAAWVAAGLVELGRERPRASAGARAQKTPGGAARARAATDLTLDLPVELQQRILEFEAKLSRPYHEILGVARDADERAIKRAYFKLSKLFHPDRYFGKRVGPFAERLDRIFKRVALAYELLLDPATRAEIERQPVEEVAPAAPPAAGAAPRKESRSEWLARVRRQFKMPERILVERRFKARQFADAARVAQHRRSFLEAASCIRLAISFDPWTDDYKNAFAEIQAEVNRMRADKLLAEAGGELGARGASEALRLLEEALAYRPSDPDILRRAAEVSLEVEDFERAVEYAEGLCGLEPDVAGHQLLLAQALRREGRRERAREVLERARQIDPGDARIQQELQRLRARSLGSSGGMR
jgi:curved DNA-binding protein CbpA